MTQKSPRPVDIHVGQRMRTRRQILDVSQTDLADRLGITFQQIQKYEKGTNRISASRLVEIAAALEVPVTYFFDGLDGAHAGRRDHDDLLIDSNGVALLRAFNRISDKTVQRALISIAQAAGASAPQLRRPRNDPLLHKRTLAGRGLGLDGGRLSRKGVGAFGMEALAPGLHLCECPPLHVDDELPLLHVSAKRRDPCFVCGWLTLE